MKGSYIKSDYPLVVLQHSHFCLLNYLLLFILILPNSIIVYLLLSLSLPLHHFYPHFLPVYARTPGADFFLYSLSQYYFSLFEFDIFHPFVILFYTMEHYHKLRTLKTLNDFTFDWHKSENLISFEPETKDKLKSKNQYHLD